MPEAFSDLLAWVVVFAFGVGTLLARRDRRVARAATAGAWGLFALFWLQLFPHFAFVQKSYVEGILSLAAVPACLYAGWLLFRGRDSLFVLSRAVAVMGLVYLPFETIPAIAVGGVTLPAPRRVLIQTVASQTETIMNLLGYYPETVAGPETGYADLAFVSYADSGHRLRFEIVLACTGLGSIAIFAGLVGAVRAPLRKKLRALAVVVPVIWVLNLARTTFIGVAFGTQSMHYFPDAVLFLFGSDDPYRVSFFLSDRVLSQVLAVFALMGLAYVLVRVLPELLTVVEDVLYVLTNEEHDLYAALDVPAPRTDGGIADDEGTSVSAGDDRDASGDRDTS
ncbi:archaeosortase A [Halegenticoccus tardaugens]|uniref:archaeosortase A n=1 Tax=Halegenticoccus tardaugens TaxID=2071624 RepID=UPI00100B5211|nr:archaeosortase A [Halegenticoccus tardaugens]